MNSNIRLMPKYYINSQRSSPIRDKCCLSTLICATTLAFMVAFVKIWLDIAILTYRYDHIQAHEQALSP
jgi:hypothetical protein